MIVSLCQGLNGIGEVFEIFLELFKSWEHVVKRAPDKQILL